MKADDQIREILASFGEDFLSNTWVVPGGKARAIHHHCTERMAALSGIKFSMPEIVSADQNNVVIVVKGTAKTGEETWSFGEASPKNNKNSYPFSMAEKRAKDRVALKLLKLHGLVYSEAEADEFRNGDARSEDAPAPQRKPLPGNAEYGHTPKRLPETVIDEIMETPTDDQVTIFHDMKKMLDKATTVAALNRVLDEFPAELKARTPDQKQRLWNIYKVKKAAFEVKEPA
jgi:hypothetical protein